MDINDTNVLLNINKLIAIKRLNKKQILHIVKIATISNDIDELEDNLKWESYKSNY